MAFYKTSWFKYIKNLIIGVGAAVVLLGALEKINSTQLIPGVDLITWGLVVEAGLFVFLGILPPAKDYYWEKLYPGLDNYHASLSPLSDAPLNDTPKVPALDGEKMDAKLGGMLTELQSMSSSLGSLKALQEVDFSGTGDQMKKMGDFYSNMNEALANISDSLEDTKVYKEQLSALNKNLGSLNSVYGNVLNAMSSIGK